MRIAVAAFAVLLLTLCAPHAAEAGFPSSCVVDHAIDGDTFVCTDANIVSLLSVNAPEINDCGGTWAKAALENIFLRPGTTVRLEYGTHRGDRLGATIAAPIVTGADGASYNISIVMAYVGLARASHAGENNAIRDWAIAAETWARGAGWNMWAAGGPFNGATTCG